MKICPNCKKHISEYALSCPHCDNEKLDNAEFDANPQKRNFTTLILLLLVIPALCIFNTLYFLTYEEEAPWKPKEPSATISYVREEENKDDYNSDNKADILKRYLKENGGIEEYKKTITGDYEIYSISYSKDKGDVVFSCMILEDITESELKNYSYENIKMLTTIYLDSESKYSAASWYYFITDSTTYHATANIDKSIFSKSNNTVYDTNITGLANINHYNITESMFTGNLASTLEYAEHLLEEADIGVSLYDLGYTNYKMLEG